MVGGEGQEAVTEEGGGRGGQERALEQGMTHLVDGGLLRASHTPRGSPKAGGEKSILLIDRVLAATKLYTIIRFEGKG